MTTLIFLSLFFIAQTTATAPAPTTAPGNPATAPAAYSKYASALPRGGNIAIITISGVIYDHTYESIKLRCDRAIKEGVTTIVFELDTPGGVLTSALNIAQYIKNLNVPTVAWIHNQAYSAGILIASSCNSIIVSPVARLGDCAPIVPGINLSPTERAKALSPLLAEFRDSAARTNTDYALFQAMCVLGVELYEIEESDTGQRKIVNQADYAVMVLGQSPDAALRQTSNADPLLGMVFGAPQTTTAPAAAPMPTMSSPPVSVGVMVSASQRGKWKLVKKIHDGTTLLTVNQTEAIDMGLARSVVKNEADLQQFLGGTSVTHYDPTWSQGLASWLTWMPIRALLLVLMVVGLYLEAQAPGLIIPGVVAVISMVLLLAAPFIIGLAEWWHILLFVVGVVLFILEMVPPPTFGLLAVAGIIMMFVGLVLAVVPTSGHSALPPAEMTARLQQSAVWTLLGLFGSGIGFYYITVYFGKIPFLSKLILRSPAPSNPQTQLAAAQAGLTTVSGDEVIGRGLIRVGHVGKAISTLRPTGRADIDGQIIDVISVGQWIDTGTSVRVVEVQGNRIVVDINEQK